jgi:REP element-mobilizing transposase RayT
MPQKFIRKSNRLPFDHLYKEGYWYFVTICILDKRCIFGEIESGEMNLNSIGKIVENKVKSLPKFYNLTLDEFVIMPNHLHLIIGGGDKSLSKIIGGLKSFCLKEIKVFVEEGSRLPLAHTLEIKNGEENFLKNEGRMETKNEDQELITNRDQKTSATKYLIQNYKTIWQKSFYDHVIRNEKGLNRVREYIFNNPINWHLDKADKCRLLNKIKKAQLSILYQTELMIKASLQK